MELREEVDSMHSFVLETKAGIVTGGIVSAGVLVWFLFTPSRGPLLPSYSGSSVAFLLLAISLPAILGGTIGGGIIEGVLIRKYILGNQALLSHKPACVIGSILGGVLFYPIGAFLGIVSGTIWGGAIGSSTGTKVGITNTIPAGIGIAIGISMIAILMTLVGAILGALLGFAFYSIAEKARELF